jgi:hypothetical protein
VQAFWGVQMQAFRKQAERVAHERAARGPR